MTSLPYLQSSEIHTHYTSINSLRLCYVRRAGDIEMSDDTAYDTAHHTHVTCADKCQYYEDVSKL